MGNAEDPLTTADRNARLYNVERDLAMLTSQLGQVLSRLPPPVSVLTTDAFSTPRQSHDLGTNVRGSTTALRSRGLALWSSLCGRGNVMSGRGDLGSGSVGDRGDDNRSIHSDEFFHYSRPRRPIDTSMMEKLHADVTLATLKLWKNRWDDFCRLNRIH